MSIDTAFTSFPSLTTKRLHLRQIRLTDAEAFFAIKSNPAVTEPYAREPHQSLAETREFIQHVLDLYKRRKSFYWAITFKGEDTIIGSYTLWNLSPDLRCAEIGYELAPAYWRQGIVTDAMSAVLTYGFNELELHRIEAVVNADNLPSRNLLLKAGFTHEGSLRQRIFFRDRFVDEQYFGLLKQEWQ